MTETKQTVGQTTTVNTEKGTMSNVQVINWGDRIVSKTFDEWTIYAIGDENKVDFYAKKNDNDIAVFWLCGQQMSIDEVSEDMLDYENEMANNCVGKFERAISLVADIEEDILVNEIRNKED